MDKRLLIGIGILILVGLSFLFVTNMTGNVITGSAATDEVVENEYFKISDFGNERVAEVIEDGDGRSR